MTFFSFDCPRCGLRARTRVRDVDYDEEGHPVRIRRCANGHTFSTEERIIGEGTSPFHGRATNRLAKSFKDYRRQPGICHVCNHPFKRGWYYRRHVNTAPHLAAVHPGSVRQRERARDRARENYWRERYGMPPPPREPQSASVLYDEVRDR
jgi:hypothetical protein